MNTKQIEVGGKTYTLTTRRNIMFNLMKVAPSAMKIIRSKKSGEEVDEALQYDGACEIYDHIDVLFYEMIKIAHPNIDKDKSDSIFEAFCNEYNDVEEHLFDFFIESFTDGIPREQKKNLNW